MGLEFNKKKSSISDMISSDGTIRSTSDSFKLFIDDSINRPSLNYGSVSAFAENVFVVDKPKSSISDMILSDGTIRSTSDSFSTGSFGVFRDSSSVIPNFDYSSIGGLSANSFLVNESKSSILDMISSDGTIRFTSDAFLTGSFGVHRDSSSVIPSLDLGQNFTSTSLSSDKINVIQKTKEYFESRLGGTLDIDIQQELQKTLGGECDFYDLKRDAVCIRSDKNVVNVIIVCLNINGDVIGQNQISAVNINRFN